MFRRQNAMPIVVFALKDGRRVLVNARHEGTSILVDDSLALNHDPEGRLTGAWLEGKNYLRSLSNRIIEKQEGPKPGLSYRVRRELGRQEAEGFLRNVHNQIVEYRLAISDPSAVIVNGASTQDREYVLAALDTVLACDPATLESHADAFHKLYQSLPILPPDQYRAVVLQATEGCSFNRCKFCGFYREREFRIKTIDEFKRHMRSVRSFLGETIRLRHSLFLADANALVIPQSQLLSFFDAVRTEYPVMPRSFNKAERQAWTEEHPIYFDGVYSFIDAFTTRLKSAADYAELASRGLTRVYLGAESGDPELLRFLGKPSSPDDALNVVRELKGGGVAVGVIILVGAGGRMYAAQHVDRTVDLVNAMPLDSGDIIYFSELVDYAGSHYSTLARQAGIEPLSVEEIQEQMKEMRTRVRFVDPASAPRISIYDIREFNY